MGESKCVMKKSKKKNEGREDNRLDNVFLCNLLLHRTKDRRDIMKKEDMDRIEKGKLTIDDFEAAKATIAEAKAKITGEEAKKMFFDSVEFNNELQIFVMNQMKVKELSPNFVVGTLSKLAWSILREDEINQMRAMGKYSQGGR